MLFSHKHDKKTVVVFDVQSSIVRASLITLESGANPHVLLTVDQLISYREESNANYLIKATLQALDSCEELINRYINASRHKNYDGKRDIIKISEVHFVLSSPWIVSKARTITQTFPKALAIDKKIVMGLISEERKKDVPEQAENIEIIEEKIFDVKLNGYSVDDWEGKMVNSIDVSFAVSIAGSGMIQRFKQSAISMVSEKNTYFHSALLLQHVGMSIILPENKDYVLIHAHGELSDVVIAENGACMFFGSFPYGTNSMIRSIAKELKVGMNTADSLITLSVSGHLDPVEEEKTVKVMDAVSERWNSSFKNLLEGTKHFSRAFLAVIITARIHEKFFTDNFMRAYPEAKIEPFSMDKLLLHVSFGTGAEQLRLTGLYAVAINNLSDTRS